MIPYSDLIEINKLARQLPAGWIFNNKEPVHWYKPDSGYPCWRTFIEYREPDGTFHLATGCDNDPIGAFAAAVDDARDQQSMLDERDAKSEPVNKAEFILEHTKYTIFDKKQDLYKILSFMIEEIKVLKEKMNER